MIDALTDTLEIRLLHPDAVAPARMRSGDAGYDLRATERVAIPQEGRRLVGTGVAIALPEGVAGLVTPRSGLAIEHGIGLLNAPGLIDPGYRGEIKVILHNTSERRYTVEIGDRIAQLLLVPYWAPELEVVEELPATERGTDGFGSSGRAWRPGPLRRSSADRTGGRSCHEIHVCHGFRDTSGRSDRGYAAATVACPVPPSGVLRRGRTPM
jgi:dUTP pyrophosphatase